jgi:hypothetical protein
VDFARAVVEFFVERRGKGSAISSADEQLVMQWEEAGVPVSVVFAGIDTAFDRKSEAPKSLSDCKRWVTAAFKKWSGGDKLEAASHSGTGAGALPGATADATAGAPDDGDTSSWEERFIGELVERAGAMRPEVRSATEVVVGELRALIARGALTPDLITVVDEAIAESALAALEPGERARVVAEAERAIGGRAMSGAAWAAARAREVLRALEG